MAVQRFYVGSLLCVIGDSEFNGIMAKVYSGNECIDHRENCFSMDDAAEIAKVMAQGILARAAAPNPQA